MTYKRLLFVLGISLIIYLLPELFFHNAMLYIVGGLVGGTLKEVLGFFGSKPSDSFVFFVWFMLLVGVVFLYYRPQNKLLKYLNVVIVFGLLYLLDFMVYEILPDNLKSQLITGIIVFSKSLVLSLIIYFNVRQNKKATQ